MVDPFPGAEPASGSKKYRRCDPLRQKPAPPSRAAAEARWPAAVAPGLRLRARIRECRSCAASTHRAVLESELPRGHCSADGRLLPRLQCRAASNPTETPPHLLAPASVVRF